MPSVTGGAPLVIWCVARRRRCQSSSGSTGPTLMRLMRLIVNTLPVVAPADGDAHLVKMSSLTIVTTRVTSARHSFVPCISRLLLLALSHWSPVALAPFRFLALAPDSPSFGCCFPKRSACSTGSAQHYSTTSFLVAPDIAKRSHHVDQEKTLLRSISNICKIISLAWLSPLAWCTMFHSLDFCENNSDFFLRQSSSRAMEWRRTCPRNGSRACIVYEHAGTRMRTSFCAWH